MIPARLRQQVRDRAGLRCEYCLLAEDDAFFPHEPDHVIALKHGGATDEANLALACFDCNRCKGSDIASLDTETGALCALFNPRSDVWATRFATAAGAVVPRTAVARVTVTLLRINAPARLEVRSELATLGRWPAPKSAP